MNTLRSALATLVVAAAACAGAASPPAGFRSLFNGTDLTGWEGKADVWKVEDGLIVGSSPGMRHNEFLATTQKFHDFILQAEFRLLNGVGNSGIQFRSDRIPNSTEMKGYQADIGDGYWGCLYDESRRNKVLMHPDREAKTKDRLKTALRKDGWNHYQLRVMGAHIQLQINGVMTVDYREPDAAIAAVAGSFGLQLHAHNAPSRVEFRNIYIQELPDSKPASADATGFLQKQLGSEDENHKYVVYLPKSYKAEGDRHYPAILFLHGSGETGDDGQLQLKAGLAPAVLQRPDFEFIVVFPQSHKRSWKADSVDGVRALKALDAAMRDYHIDANRVHLTGLSMGGAGTWSQATTHPERWATATMVCGFGDAADAAKVGKLPFQIFCGDKDNRRIVDGSKAIEAALRSSGSLEKATWYPGVGHNCWDLAYNTDALFTWMLEHRRAAAK